MTHARAQVRAGLLPLITGLTTTGSSAFDSRGFELDEADFPFWVLYTLNEEAEQVAMGGKLRRELEVLVAGAVRELDGATAYAKLDTMLEELETALSASAVKAAVPGIRGWALDRVEITEAADEVDRLLLGVEVYYLCGYFTDDGAPGAFG